MFKVNPAAISVHKELINAQDNAHPLQDWLDKHSFAIIPMVQIEIDFLEN